MFRFNTALPKAIAVSGPGALALLLVVLGCGPRPAFAQSQPSDPFAIPSIMVEEPHAAKQPKSAAHERQHRRKDVERTIPRGSATVVPPISTPGQLPRTPLLVQPQVVAPYNPPPISNPSERITQFNHSFPLNGGLGNNPADRDAYIRYNLNR